MTSIAKIIAGILLACVLLATGYWTGHQSNTASKMSAPSTETINSKKTLYWYDPMVPNQHFDKPGKSPFMDMQLVPMYDEPGQTEGTVAVDSRTSQSLGIRTAKVAEGTFSQRIDTVGYIKPDERKQVIVQSRAAGWVEQLGVRATNDPVKKGQLLLSINAPDLIAAQKEYLLARSDLHGDLDGQTLTEAARQKLLLLGISAGQIQQLQKTGQAQRLVNIYSPANGIVAELAVRQGMQVLPGMNLFTLVDLSSVWLTAELAENQGSWISQGTQAEVTFPALAGKNYKGKIEYVLPQISATSRTLQVRIRLDNPLGELKPGMFANVALLNGTKQSALVVPSEAVITTGKRSVVIISEGNGKFRPVEVKIGRESAGQIEILNGLSAGQMIVTSGQFLIDSESNLKSGIGRLEEVAPAIAKPVMPSAMPKIHKGHGKVDSVDLKSAQVTLSHDAIATMNWPAMTMAFPVSDKAALNALKQNEMVDFEFTEIAPGNFSINRIVPAKQVSP